MALRRELIPLGLALLLLGGVGAMAVQARAGRIAHDAAAPPSGIDAIEAEAGEPGADSGSAEVAATGEPVISHPAPEGRVDPADLGALPLREAALPVPTRDVAEIRQAIRTRGRGTYLGEMLAEEDSVLSRWPDRTVAALRVWVQPRADVPHWNAEYPALVRDVFPEWSAAGFPMRFLHVLDSASADLHVTFTTSFPGRRIGVTRRYRDRSGWIVAASVVIGTESPDGRAFPPALITAIARHEVGHALGLGHTTDRGAVMFPESYTTVITATDRATLDRKSVV